MNANSPAEPLHPDLSSRAAIHDLVVEFYREVVFDELLEQVFGEVAEVDWAAHIPVLVDYWCGILLGGQRTGGKMIAAHRRVHELQHIESEHCDRWYSLWVRCIDSRWSGPFAEHAASHAATLMSGLAKHVFDVPWTAPSRPSLPDSGETTTTSDAP